VAEQSVEPVLLALSTYRRSSELARNTVALAKREGRPLLVAFVIDENVDRYLPYTDVVSAEHLETLTRGRNEFLAECKRAAEECIAEVAGIARAEGVACQTVVVSGRFGIEIQKIIDERKPAKVTLTRSRRPAWVLQLFGSPVDYVVEHAPCPVLVDYALEETQRGEARAPREWYKALFSFRKSTEGVRGGVVLLAAIFFLAMSLTPPPRGLVELVSEDNPVGYSLRTGTTTITENVNAILGTKLDATQVAQKAKIMVAILCAAALLWATEAIPLGATDLLVGALLYLFYVLPLDAISKAYMKDAVFFIFGVLALAAGAAKTGLDRRIGLLFLRRVKGLKSFCFVFLPLLAVSAGFLSEHALVAILVPVLLRVYRGICDAHGVRADRPLAVLLILGVCFAANQGGPGSPAAGGRNAIMVGYLKDYGLPISFAEWVMYAMPFVVVVSFCVGAYMYFALRRRMTIPRPDFSAYVRKEAETLPRWSAREIAMALIVLMVVTLWVTASKRFGLGGPCMFAVVLMLVTNVVSWKDVQTKVRFDVVGLYAAACAMGVGLKVTGASLWLARNTVGMLPESLAQGSSLVVATSAFTGTLTNFMSDGATVAAIGPVVLSMASVSGIHLWRLGLACSFSSSFANILIIGTPNNAIAYAAGTDPETGERLITLRDFLVLGLPVTLIALAVLWGWALFGYWSWLPWP